jgi:hypothetical protein
MVVSLSWSLGVMFGTLHAMVTAAPAGSVVRKEGRSVPYSQEVVNVLCKGRVRLVRILTFGWSGKSY